MYAIATGANILGGLAGGEAGRADRNRSHDMLRQIYESIANINLPEIDKQRLELALQKSVGELAPSQENLMELGAKDALQDITIDPRLKAMQLDKMNLLSKLGDTAFSPEEQAQLNAMRRQVEADANSRLRQLLEQQQERGVGTSDSALALRARGAQSAANRQAEEADRLAAMAHNRALAATTGAAQLAGSMEQAEYARESELARALNAREQFNMQAGIGRQQRNIDRFNSAQQFNLSNAQNMANTNVALQNQQQMHNKNLQQQRYQNELNKASAMTGAGTNLASSYKSKGDAEAAKWQGVGSGISEGIGSYAAYNLKSKNPWGYGWGGNNEGNV
jgi:hypothetical protein